MNLNSSSYERAAQQEGLASSYYYLDYMVFKFGRDTSCKAQDTLVGTPIGTGEDSL